MLIKVLFWVAIIMMVDSGVGILGLHYWQKKIPKINIQRLALMEAVLAVLILAVCYLLK